MGNSLYLISLILIVLWAIGFFGFGESGYIHILLILALAAILIRIIGGDRST